MTIVVAASSPRQFSHWRKSVHNSVAHQRRQSLWWRGVGLWGWWNGVDLRGIVELGSIAPTEFISALRRLGEVSLRPLEIGNVRTEVYRTARSVSTVPKADAAGRYQPLKIAIEPVTVAVPMVTLVGSRMIEAMPMIV
ncbi:MAG: hypothetical protein J0J10_20055 [Bosea sp.]|uniref:hypothetical protein n=1 Tax=Bosea sp. (in: a-proteobacteria) TaxID=1871050 RepID=UPI001AD33D29|nr:hypothetical protein [Bosea sp. (in: a-proteobacteria)]MBN9471066.1 hypothetical protein [Bosea sp. (in: a-proteobacteria)]